MAAISRVGIVAKPQLEEVATHLEQTAAWLEARRIEPVFEANTAGLGRVGAGRRSASRDELPRLVDLLLVFGGDGTFLAVADRVAESGRDIPILGVNFGHLGFLTEVAWTGMFASLEAAIAGEAAFDHRLVIRASVRRSGLETARRFALNDVVVTRGALSRIIPLSVTVGGEFVATFHADGLIISSPTGSTAYNLSAGGPIVHPDVDALVLTPIAPHMLSNRPVVIPASTEVVVHPVALDAGQEAYVSIDGQSGQGLEPGDTLHVARHDHPIRLVESSSHSYFEVLRKKLKWAER
ncbi:MAG TPA: NAD(+)/NADH kinase [Vicinamibacterales bacterium]|nr:NAD(+)/NADH kinase [Vicinamibacterales bacterium]